MAIRSPGATHSYHTDLYPYDGSPISKVAPTLLPIVLNDVPVSNILPEKLLLGIALEELEELELDEDMELLEELLLELFELELDTDEEVEPQSLTATTLQE